MNIKKPQPIFISLILAFVMLVSVFTFTQSTTVPVQAQYGSFEQCQNFTNPVKREECNARIQARVDRRINRVTQRAQNQIQRAIIRGSQNLSAVILSILNVLYWEIWNVINVIFPLA